MTSPEAIRDQDDQLYAVLKERASNKVNDMTTRNLYDVRVTFTPAAIGVEDASDSLSAVSAFSSTPEAVAAMTAALADQLGLDISAFSNVGLVLSREVIMRYSVFAPKSMVNDIDGSSSNTDAYTKSLSVSAFVTDGIAPAATAAEKAALTGVQFAFAARALRTAGMTANPNAVGRPCKMDCLSKYNAFLNIALWFADPSTTVNNLCPDSICGDAAAILLQIGSEQGSRLGSLYTNAAQTMTFDSISMALANTDFRNRNGNDDAAATFMQQVTSGLASFATDLANLQKMAQASTSPVPNFNVGNRVPTVFLYQLGNKFNAESFRSYVNSLVRGTGPVMTVTGLNTAIAPLSRRDLSTTPIENMEMQVSSAINIACLSNDCDIGSSPATLKAIQDRVELATLAYKIRYHPCSVKKPGVSGLDDSTINRVWDDNCLATTAANWATMQPRPTFNTMNVTADAIKAFVRDIIKCDYRGEKSGGSSCWGAFSDADNKANNVGQTAFLQAQASVAAATTTTTTTTTPAATADGQAARGTASSSSSNSNTGIIVAAVCAAVVILAILAFVAMRKKNSGGAATTTTASEPKQKDRTMVAFQNPMYDQVDGQAEADPTYSNAETLGAADNTFHEPVFHQEAPAAGGYMDTEAAADDDEEEDDYNDPGYMDVNIGNDDDDANDSDF